MTQTPTDKNDAPPQRSAVTAARTAEGDRRLAAQHKLISELERAGHDATEAKADLEALQLRQHRRRTRPSR